MMRATSFVLVLSVGADASASAGGSLGQAGTGGTFTPTHKVDMLFVIKDSGSTRLMQDNLLRNFPTFASRLMDPPGLPDLHIAVVTSDLGAGDGSIPGCNATGGKNGIFQYTARGTCVSFARSNRFPISRSWSRRSPAC